MLNDTRIRALALDGMIEKFQDGQIKRIDGQRVISYGLSSFGYDMRVADESDFQPSNRRPDCHRPKGDGRAVR